jgi:hypothetical protein
MEQPMAPATATAPSRTQIHVAPHPTYVSAAWARDHPEYAAQAVSGAKTILNVMDAEITEEQTWRFVADAKAPAYVQNVAKGLNGIGSTWRRAVDGAWMATDAAFNFANFLIDTNPNDQKLIQAMMDLFGTATTVITAPVKATLAVGAVNMYPGMRIVFVDAAPQKAANNINRFNRISPEQGLTNEEQSLIDATNQTTPNLKEDEPGVVGDFTATPDYAAEVAAQNGR